MKKKNVAVAAEEAVENVNETIEEPVATEEKAGKKRQKGKRELHDLFWIIGLILGVISLLVVLVAKNAINNGGVWTIQMFFMKKPLKINFVTSYLTSLIAGILAVLSVGCGVTRNILKKQNWLLGYLVGLVALILSVMAYMAATTAK